MFLEIDGLAMPVLKRGMRDGSAPELSRWLEEGTHRLVEWETDFSSQTGASQAGILLGSNEDIPAFRGLSAQPNMIKLKHFGAAAASSGGVEMYHIIGVTPEAPSLDAALGSKKPVAAIHYGPAERRRVYESLNSNGRDLNVDYVMLGCPHASIDQIGEAAQLLAGKKIRSGSSLWLFTSRAVKSVADLHGYTKTIRDAGGLVMTDTCSAIGRMLPSPQHSAMCSALSTSRPVASTRCTGSSAGSRVVASTLPRQTADSLIATLSEEKKMMESVVVSGKAIPRADVSVRGEPWIALLAPLLDAAGKTVGSVRVSS